MHAQKQKRARGAGHAKRNLLILAAVLVLALSLFPTHKAHAFLDDIAGKAVGTLVYGINYILSLIAGVAIMVEAWFIGVLLQMSQNVVNVDIVQTGFSVSLSIANLGFVFGIIVIAIATIIHYQTYGIKQILWKLIVMAILVNFGLVIAGTIIGFSNTLTNYFMTALPGQGNNYLTFAEQMAAIFQPQSLVFPNALNNSQSTAANMMGQAGSTLGDVIQNIGGLVFGLVALVMIIVTLALFAVMLIIRYVYFVILLILLPLAWLCYVFPSLSTHYHKWWNQFLRWCFFAPIAMFFIYLVIMAGNSMMAGSADQYGIFKNANIANFSSTNTNGVIQGISNFFGALLTPILTTFIKDIVLVALTVGGIFVANSMGLAGAGMAMGAVNKVSKSMQGFAGKQAAKGGRRAWQAAGGERAEKALREGKISKQVKKIPIIGAPLGWVTGRGEREAALGLGKITKNERMVGEEKGRLRGKPPDELKELLNSGNLNTEMKFAAIDLLRGKKKVTDDTKIDRGTSTAGKFMSDWDTIKRYRQEEMTDDYDKLTMSTVNERAAKKARESPRFEAADAEGEKLRREAYEKTRTSPTTEATANKERDTAYADTYKAAEEGANKEYQAAKKAELDVGNSKEEAEARAQEARKKYLEREGVETKAKEAGEKAKQEYIESEAEKAGDKAKEEYMDKNVPESVSKIKAQRKVEDENGETIYKEGDLVPVIKLLEESQKEFLRKFSKADASSVDSNALFGPQSFAGKKLAETQMLIKNIALYAPQIVPNLVSNMKSPAMKKFSPEYSETLKGLIGQARTQVNSLKGDTTTNEYKEADQTLGRLKRAQRVLDRIENNFLGLVTAAGKKEGGEVGGGTEVKETKT